MKKLLILAIALCVAGAASAQVAHRVRGIGNAGKFVGCQQREIVARRIGWQLPGRSAEVERWTGRNA